VIKATGHAVGDRLGADRLIALFAVAGGGGVITGAVLPWLSVYYGLDTYNGTAGTNGLLLVAGGAAVVLLGLWYALRRRAGVRYLIAGLGFALALFSAYLLAELLALDKQLHAGFLPALGPGVFVASGGALLILATLFINAGRAVPARSAAGTKVAASLDSITVALVSLSAAAGTVHLAVAADHFAEYFLFGLFFIVAGVGQVAWAALVALAGASRTLLLLATGNLLIVALWAVSRTSGIPLGPNAGTPERIGFSDTVTTVFEVLVVVLAARLLLSRRSHWRQARALWAAPLLIASTAALAVLSAVGAVGFLPSSG
jgi:hypothetical protein